MTRVTATRRTSWKTMLGRTLILVPCLLASAAAPASADTIGWGIPVAGAGSNTQVGLPIVSLDATPDGTSNATPNWIKYYIPLSNAKSGTYGVTDVTPDAIPGCTTGTDCAGTFSDSGSGNSFLDMFLKFTPVAPLPLASARLEFEFADLDLKYVNDPVGFFETVQLFSATGTALSPKFTQAPATVGTGSFGSPAINWELSRTAGSAGASWPVYLDFWGPGLTSIIDGTFWAKLTFTIPSVASGTNTPEYLRASLTTSTGTTSVPEPGSMFLLGFGLTALAAARSRNTRARLG